MKEKGKANLRDTIEIIDALERVYNGEDSDRVLVGVELKNPLGEPPDVLLKAYKWIWGQEGVNYPDGKGRAMSWEGWTKKDGNWEKTGDGIADLRDVLKRNIGK